MKAIEVQGLRRTFGAFVAVDDVRFEVGRGEIFGWLGANGAGKSTTIRMLIGALAPTAGDAIVAGVRLSKDPVGIKRRIGYMSQRFSLYPDLTVGQNLDFFGGAYGLSGARLRARRAAVAEAVDLPDADLVTGELPGGTRQRVALAAALLHEPAIVFLDEPTAGVDPVSRRRFWDLIRALAADGVTVFVTTHHLDEAEQCARVGLMVDGKLVALDTPAGLAATWVPGDLWRLSGTGVFGLRPALAALPGVREVQTFGAALHVRIGEGASPEPLRTVAAGVRDLRLEPVRATLEDVFLAVVRRDERAA